MNPRAEPSAAIAPDSGLAPSSRSGESGGAHATAGDAIENVGVSRPIGPAQTVEPASGRIAPG